MTTATNEGTIRVLSPGRIVHATHPLIRSVKFGPTLRCPFELVSPEGKRLKTQWEPVVVDEDGEVKVAEFFAVDDDGPLRVGPTDYTVELSLIHI